MSIWPVTSLQVAEAFGKEHKNVIADIRNMLISSNFHALNFQPMSVPVAIGNKAIRLSPAYRLTRDGFMLLATWATQGPRQWPSGIL